MIEWIKTESSLPSAGDEILYVRWEGWCTFGMPAKKAFGHCKNVNGKRHKSEAKLEWEKAIESLLRVN